MEGTLSLGTVGKIQFPATQSPSTDVHTLDDYEEGTWTPTLTFGGASVGITYNQRVGAYIKIGKLVHVSARIILTNKGSSTGTAGFTGLPFTCADNGNTTQYTMHCGYWASLAAAAIPGGYVVQNQTNIVMVSVASGTSVTGFDNTVCSNTTDLIFDAFYMAST
jgi:hypothetical protein